jgi:hypothetical protein
MIRPLETQPKHVRSIFDLIICISKLSPALTVSRRQLCKTNSPLPPARVWEDLPRLGRSLGGAYEGGFGRFLNKETETILYIGRSISPGGAPRTGFISAHELLGLLMKHDPTRLRIDVNALWTISEALEHLIPNPCNQQQQTRSLYHLPAATRLIETAGRRICQWCRGRRRSLSKIIWVRCGPTKAAPARSDGSSGRRDNAS